MLDGEWTPERLVMGLAHGFNYSHLRAPLVRLYWAFFLRVPDLGGMDYWLGRLSAGTSLPGIASELAKSPEFQSTYGSLSNKAFVKLVYKNVLARDADPAGLAFWTSSSTSTRRPAAT
ncbi:MAG: hypothetical protein JWN46_3852 [Acidimicrobiales bacterium]|nr:hypothetical protein [Acidimicrobiales bacterium]